jgi:hypothetical protein
MLQINTRKITSSLIITVLVNIKQRLPIFQSELTYESNCTKNYLMSFYVVSKDATQATPLLEALVDGFMSCSDSRLRIASWHWCIDILSFPAVTQVSFHLLAIFQFIYQISSKNCNVWVLPTRKGTINPHYVPGANAQTHLVSNSRTLEFVRKPSRPKWFPIEDAKVRSIDRHLTHHGNGLPIRS